MKGKGVVVSLDGSRAKVKVTLDDECTGCLSKDHCHVSTISDREIVVINDYGAHVSDRVIFESDAGKVILSAVLIWILPLLSMFVGYVIASRFSSGFLPIGAALLFLAGSFLILKLIDNAVTGGKAFYPRISKIIDTQEACREQ
ncbi:MAG: SoxR reducing system RseC family protein [Candidatus Latescibacteria bacterium]|jgi:positive regulator of sigma E activity|nr:SoxR reducing system RseC family protein [Candidatus Latescibacterota bacterium]